MELIFLRSLGGAPSHFSPSLWAQSETLPVPTWDWTDEIQNNSTLFFLYPTHIDRYVHIYLYVCVYMYIWSYTHVYTNIYIYIYSFLEDSEDYLSRYLACLVPLSSSRWWAQIQKRWGTRYLCVKEGLAQGMAQPYLVLAPGSAPKLSWPVSHRQLCLYLLDNPYRPEVQLKDSGHWRLTTYSFLPLECYC